ncbi:MAG TPA: sigma-70 family RNA polymerase sigma factor [Methylomirabilota bacterium]|nr:sigma-70 family RNA polymerase sigma factor [Methylomirabilota bacterium]
MPEQADELIPTRASLLHRLKNLDDGVSWEQFVDIYSPLIYGVTRRSGLSDSEAKDVVQETLIAVAKHMPGFTYDATNGHFKTWLLNMTRWRIIDHMRKRAKSKGDEHTALHGGETSIKPIDRIIDPASNVLDNLWETEWQKALLEAAVATVKRRVEPQNYQLFDFYVNKDWPPAKVASTFNVAIDQVYLAKHRITELLKAEVARLERDRA